MRRLFGDDFCPAMRCISAAYAGMRCLSVCLSVRVSVTFVSCVKTNKDTFEIFSPSGSQAIIEFYALVNLKLQQLVIKNRAIGMLKLTTRGLSATAELLVRYIVVKWISASVSL